MKLTMAGSASKLAKQVQELRPDDSIDSLLDEMWQPPVMNGSQVR